MASVMASNVPDGLLTVGFTYCSVVGLWHVTVAEYVCVYVFHSWSSAGISVGSTPAIQAYDVKRIDSDSYSAIKFYTIFVLDTINAAVNLKQLYLCKN